MITFSQKTLREALVGLRVIKPAKQTLPMLRCVRITGSNDAVRFDVTNLDEHLVFETNGNERNTASCEVLVPYETLDGVAKSADAGSDITVLPLPDPTISCISGGSPVILPFKAELPSEFPKTPSPGGRPPVGLSSDILVSMAEATGCASTDSNRYVLNSVLLSKHVVASCDGRQLYVRNSLDLPLPDEGLVFPLSGVLGIVAKAATETLLFTTWKQGDMAFARIVAGPWMWTTKLVSGNYPNWRQVVPSLDHYKAHLRFSDEDAARLKTVLPRLPGYKDEHSPVCLTIRKEGAFLNPPPHLPQVRIDLSKSEVVAAQASKGEDSKDVQFDAKYLLGALQRGFRDLHVCDDVTPLVMRDGHRMNLWIPNRPRIGPPRDHSATTPSAATAITPKAADASDTRPATVQTVSCQPTTTIHQPNKTMVAIAQPNTVPVSQQAKPQPRSIAAPETSVSGSDGVQQSIQHARDLLRELNGALGNIQVLIRESSRQYKVLERDHEALKKNIRALRTVEV